MQSTERTIVAYIEEVLGSASSTWTVEIVGHVVIRSQSSVSDVKTACERRKRKSCRKALVKFDELVMLMTIEKPKDKGKVDANTTPKSSLARLTELSKGFGEYNVEWASQLRGPQSTSSTESESIEWGRAAKAILRVKGALDACRVKPVPCDGCVDNDALRQRLLSEARASSCPRGYVSFQFLCTR